MLRIKEIVFIAEKFFKNSSQNFADLLLKAATDFIKKKIGSKSNNIQGKILFLFNVYTYIQMPMHVA